MESSMDTQHSSNRQFRILQTLRRGDILIKKSKCNAYGDGTFADDTKAGYNGYHRTQRAGVFISRLAGSRKIQRR